MASTVSVLLLPFLLFSSLFCHDQTQNLYGKDTEILFNRFLFTGDYSDGMFMRTSTRLFSSKYHRFMSRDLYHSLNRFSYTSNPINEVDHIGMLPDKISGKRNHLAKAGGIEIPPDYKDKLSEIPETIGEGVWNNGKFKRYTGIFLKTASKSSGKYEILFNQGVDLLNSKIQSNLNGISIIIGDGFFLNKKEYRSLWHPINIDTMDFRLAVFSEYSGDSFKQLTHYFVLERIKSKQDRFIEIEPYAGSASDLAGYESAINNYGQKFESLESKFGTIVISSKYKKFITATEYFRIVDNNGKDLYDSNEKIQDTFNLRLGWVWQ